MGMEFSLVAAKDGYGVQWRVPDSVSTPPGGTHAAAIWNADTSTRLGYKEFVPAVATLQDILFDSLVPLTTGVNYVACIYTVHYVFKAGTPSGLTSPSGNVVGGPGRLAAYSGGAADATEPEDNFASTYHISPLIGT
jgi:hypothetical protein